MRKPVFRVSDQVQHKPAVQPQKMARGFGFRKKRACTIYTAKTKVLVSCVATVQLICIFVFAYTKGRFSHDLHNKATSMQTNLSRVTRKPTFYICENKDPDQLCGNRKADQRFCFRHIDSTIPLLSKSVISSL